MFSNIDNRVFKLLSVLLLVTFASGVLFDGSLPAISLTVFHRQNVTNHFISR